MYETDEDLEQMQALLDASYARAGAHLLAVHEPDRRLPAKQIAACLDGMLLATLATVTSDGRPLTGPVDAFFVRGQFCFGSAPNSIRFQHIGKRPTVSLTHLQGEPFSITVHGTAQVLDMDDEDDAIATALRMACIEQYGEGWAEWAGESTYARVEADRMFSFHLDPDDADRLMAEMEAEAQKKN